jgi:hypothetical protein
MTSRGEGPIRPRIRAKLDAGDLPAEVPEAIRSGIGRGNICNACGERIGPEAIEQVVELVDGHVFRLHASCHRVWQSELRRRGVKM